MGMGGGDSRGILQRQTEPEIDHPVTEIHINSRIIDTRILRGPFQIGDMLDSKADDGEIAPITAETEFDKSLHAGA